MTSISHWGEFPHIVESFDGEYITDPEYGDRFRNRLNFQDGIASQYRDWGTGETITASGPTYGYSVYQRLNFGPFLP